MAGDPWLGGLLARRHVNVATVAFANKSARIAWALMAHGRIYTTVRARAA
jgi:transposase